MELSAQIKKYRAQLQLSQEELADRVYVTRQTVSNWENEKSYPDIHSLLLLSQLFHVSLDQLVKGDIETMKQIVNKHDIEEFNHYSKIFVALFLGLLLWSPVFVLWRKWYVAVAYGALAAAGLIVGIRIELLKKQHDIQTYKEILAFSQGKKLDELQAAAEKKKRRPYLTAFLKAMTGAGLALAALLIGIGIAKLLHLI